MRRLKTLNPFNRRNQEGSVASRSAPERVQPASPQRQSAGTPSRGVTGTLSRLRSQVGPARSRSRSPASAGSPQRSPSPKDRQLAVIQQRNPASLTGFGTQMEGLTDVIAARFT